MAHPEDIPDGASPGESGHVTDHNKISTALTNVDNRLHAVEIAAPTGMTQEQIQDMLGTFLVAGTNVTITYNDVANTLTISASGGGGGGGVTDHAALTGLTTAGAHPATAISHALTGGFITPGSVNGALSDLDTAVAFAIAGVNGHLSDTSAAHAASAISVDASGFNGNLTTGDTTVQAVAQKLDDLAVSGGGAPTGAAGGSLSGTYPNPTLADGAVTFAKIAGAAIGTSGSTVAAGNHTHTVTGEVVFGVAGAVTVRTGTAKVPNKSGRTRTITGVTITATTAPTGATMIADVNINGTTIFGTQANRPTITAGSTALFTTTGMSVASWTDGQWLTVDIDQIGSTIAGSDVTVTVHYTEAV